MTIKICVGSSCHIKGTYDMIALLEKAVAEHHLEGKITLEGNFCTGHCNRQGVTVQVEDQVHTGVTKENFAEFFRKNVLERL